MKRGENETLIDKKVVILIIAHKSKITEFEEASLAQCFNILGRYSIKIICPKGLDVACYQRIIPDIEIDFIDPIWQSNYQNFNRLKIEPFLFKRYANYEFILFYELDAFVFRDELEYWCSQNYDYIGAPWFENFDHANEFSPIIGVGNGGFSLRRVSSALKALHRFSLVHKSEELRKLTQRNHWLKTSLSLIKNCTIANNTFYLFNTFKGHEDIFWCNYVKQNFDWFKVAPIDIALKFSFECNPRILFIKNKNYLPFGCHAWYKYNLNFWLPHIKEFGYLQDLSI